MYVGMNARPVRYDQGIYNQLMVARVKPEIFVGISEDGLDGSSSQEKVNQLRNAVIHFGLEYRFWETSLTDAEKKGFSTILGGLNREVRSISNGTLTPGFLKELNFERAIGSVISRDSRRNNWVLNFMLDALGPLERALARYYTRKMEVLPGKTTFNLNQHVLVGYVDGGLNGSYKDGTILHVDSPGYTKVGSVVKKAGVVAYSDPTYHQYV